MVEVGGVLRIQTVIESFPGEAREAAKTALEGAAAFWPGPHELEHMPTCPVPNHRRTLLRLAREVAINLTRITHPDFALSGTNCQPEAAERYGRFFRNIHGTSTTDIEAAIERSRPLLPRA